MQEVSKCNTACRIIKIIYVYDTVGCDRPVLRDLVNHVSRSVANYWYDLGLQLLDPKYENELNIIEADKDDTKTSCRKMDIFGIWLWHLEQAFVGLQSWSVFFYS